MTVYSRFLDMPTIKMLIKLDFQVAATSRSFDFVDFCFDSVFNSSSLWPDIVLIGNYQPSVSFEHNPKTSPQSKTNCKCRNSVTAIANAYNTVEVRSVRALHASRQVAWDNLCNSMLGQYAKNTKISGVQDHEIVLLDLRKRECH